VEPTGQPPPAGEPRQTAKTSKTTKTSKRTETTKTTTKRQPRLAGCSVEIPVTSSYKWESQSRVQSRLWVNLGFEIVGQHPTPDTQHNDTGQEPPQDKDTETQRHRDKETKRHSSKGTPRTQELFFRVGRLGNCATPKKALQQAGLATMAQRHKKTETQGHRSTEAHRQTTTKPKPQETQPLKQTNQQTHKQRHTQTQGTGKAKGEWLANSRFTTYGGALHKDRCNANNKQMNKPQGTEAQRQPQRDTTPQGHNTTQTKNHNNRTTTQRHKGTKTPKRKGQEPPPDKDTETQTQRQGDKVKANAKATAKRNPTPPPVFTRTPCRHRPQKANTSAQCDVQWRWGQSIHCAPGHNA